MRVEILLREIREEKSISLRKLSELTNISVSQLSKIERNESEPTISTLIRISLALKTDIKNLYKIKF
jgi:transcriptional regulator with XRE-family HTH domain|nr:MAG TPA: Helix-turn-helix XRE-family like protein [Caudoviricetes sp.]DAO79975.1 MAG TPA: Helix-turn-helix XRE-family like protein [Caudoviricetes sp.]